MTSTYISTQELKNHHPISAVCEEDYLEKQFDELIKLWINNKISYKVLLENYPDYDADFTKRIIKKLSSMLY
jgi:hypothetical protein